MDLEFKILAKLSFIQNEELENHLVHYFECIYSHFFNLLGTKVRNVCIHLP